MLSWTLSGELKTDAVTASVLPPVDPEDSVDPEDPEEAVDAEDKGWEGVVEDGDSSDDVDRISDEDERISDEDERISDEDERISDEDERISDEVERISDEDERVSGEDERISDDVETGERLLAGFVLDVLIVVGPGKIFRFFLGNFFN